MARLPRAALSAALLLCASSAWATTLLQWDNLELARRSQAVVQGHVLHVTTRFSADGMRILTDVDLEVDSVWKGQPGGRVHIVQPGGQMEGLAQRVDGMAAFAEGEEVVVFLEAQPGDQYGLTGMAQGKYRVDRSKGTRAIPEPLHNAELVDVKTRKPALSVRLPMPLEELRAQVEATLPGKP